MIMSETKSTKMLTKKNIIGYAIGDAGGVLAFGVIGSFLQMFYTDILKINLGAITVLMLVARIWDAINDPICGALIDSRKPTKHGRFRPYVFWFSIPLAIAFILCFVQIPGLSEHQYLIYAYITYILYGMLYTAVNIPYGSMASAMTEDQSERSTLSVFRSLGSGIGSLPGKILLPLFVYSTIVEAGETHKVLNGTKLLYGVILLAGFMVILYFAFFKMTKENLKAPEKLEKTNVAATLKDLFKNRAFVTMCIAALILLAADMYTLTIMNYLFKDYFKTPGLYSVVTIANYIPMLALMPFMGKLTRRFGKKELCAFGSLFAVGAYLLMFILHTHNAMIFLALVLVAGFGVSFFTLEVWALVTDVIDSHEVRTGRREEGTTYSCFSFFRKLGQTVAGIGGTSALAIIGYSTAKDVVVQSDAVIEGMYNVCTLIPVILYALMFLLLQFGYPLGKKALEKLAAERDALRNKA